MQINLFSIVFIILLIDSLGAIMVSYVGKQERWYVSHLRTIARLFPPAKGWSVYYLVLVLWMGYILLQTGLI